jgi:hypothetical protein
MAKTEGEPVLDSDQEEIALSDSELDDVLKSADITSESPEAEQGDLEQYGVWVKVEPHNIEEEAEQNMSFQLSDLESRGRGKRSRRSLRAGGRSGGTGKRQRLRRARR